MKKKVFLAIAGNIGSGKSTVANLLAEIFRLEKYDEIAEDNPYLALFYDDMKTWAYKMERYCLLNSAIAHEKITMMPHSAVQDRSVYEHVHIFGKNQEQLSNLSLEESEHYWRLWEMLEKHLIPPDVLIYLRTSLPELRNRIRRRGRECEYELTKNDDPYLPMLQNLYESWYEGYTLGPKICIATDSLNIIDNPDHLTTMIGKIKNALAEHSIPLTEFIQDTEALEKDLLSPNHRQ